MKSIEAIFWGILAFIAALVAEVLLSSMSDGSYLSARTEPGLGAVMSFVMIEELAKFFVLWRASAGKIIAPAPIMVFGAVFGLIEIWLLGQKDGLGAVTGLAAALPIMLVHLGTAVIYGYCLNRKNRLWQLAGLSVGIVFHATYNLQEILQGACILPTPLKSF